MKTKTQTILAQNEGEFKTTIISCSGGRFFRGVKNGGSGGAYQPKDQVNGDWGFYHEGPTEISRAEALAACAAMGVEEVDIPEDAD